MEGEGERKPRRLPAIAFICPDGHPIKFQHCFNACRLDRRCATLAYLRLISYQREWRGVTPSMAGNGPRLEYLKKTVPYCIDPQDRAFAALGTGVHGKLSIHAYTENILAEEPLSDQQTKGIPDCLEVDEQSVNSYVLTDYKTWGSYKVRKALGMVSKEVPLLDDNGTPTFYVKGKKKGQPKTTKQWTIDCSAIDMKDTELQLNRYRILFEQSGFHISRMQVQAILRDGGTINAINNGLTKNFYLVDVPFMDNQVVLSYYKHLQEDIQAAENFNWIRKCNDWESWNGVRCERYCEVYYACEQMKP